MGNADDTCANISMVLEKEWYGGDRREAHYVQLNCSTYRIDYHLFKCDTSGLLEHGKVCSDDKDCPSEKPLCGAGMFPRVCVSCDENPSRILRGGDYVKNINNDLHAAFISNNVINSDFYNDTVNGDWIITNERWFWNDRKTILQHERYVVSYSKYGNGDSYDDSYFTTELFSLVNQTSVKQEILDNRRSTDRSGNVVLSFQHYFNYLQSITSKSDEEIA